MAVLQEPKQLTIGNAGIDVPAIAHPGAPAASQLVKVIARIPTLNASVITIATSSDGGATWQEEPYDLLQVQAFPTPTGFAGNKRLIFGPYLPGTKFRITSNQAQAALIPVYFGV